MTQNNNLSRVNELMDKAVKQGGFEKLSNIELNELFLKAINSSSYVGHIPPLILAELTSRCAKKSNFMALFVSFVALLVSAISTYQSYQGSGKEERWNNDQISTLRTLENTLIKIENLLSNPKNQLKNKPETKLKP
jgi:hypothetical protein